MGVLATDSFTRANGQLGGNWTAVVVSSGDGPVISSNAVTGVASQTRTARYTAVSAPANQYAQLLVSANYGGPAVRMAGTANASMDGYVQEGGSDSHLIQRYDDGVPTTLQTLTNLTLPKTLRLQIVGSILQAFVNGVQDGTDETDAVYATGDFGLEVFSSAASVDDWEGGDFIPGVGALVLAGNTASLNWIFNMPDEL
jgi:hypothetical protein